MKKFTVIFIALVSLSSCSNKEDELRLKKAKLYSVAKEAIQIAIESDREGNIDWPEIMKINDSDLFGAMSYGELAGNPALLVMDQESKIWLYSIGSDGYYSFNNLDGRSIEQYSRKASILRIEMNSPIVSAKK
jgi:alpha-tubulin suppressor-like RCC1 family protein